MAENKILYNVTVIIEESVEKEWLNWMKSTHIPDVMSTGYFLDYQICKILAESDGGISYAVQYTCASRKDLDVYTEIYAPNLQAKHAERYNGKFAAFRTLLEVVHKKQ